MARSRGAASLRLENYSDRELLHLIDNLADHEGWVLDEHLAERIGLRVSGMSDLELLIYTRRCVGIRLSWIKRLTGCVERHPDKKDYRWRLTDAGLAVVRAKLTSSLSNGLTQTDDANVLLALEVIGRRYTHAKPGSANLLRREWAYGTHKNRRR